MKKRFKTTIWLVILTLLTAFPVMGAVIFKSGFETLLG
jgi:hypothetical protein